MLTFILLVSIFLFFFGLYLDSKEATSNFQGCVNRSLRDNHHRPRSQPYSRRNRCRYGNHHQNENYLPDGHFYFSSQNNCRQVPVLYAQSEILFSECGHFATVSESQTNLRFFSSQGTLSSCQNLRQSPYCSNPLFYIPLTNSRVVTIQSTV